MKGKRYTTEDKIRILREADHGEKSVLEICREAHIAALGRDRTLVRANMVSSEKQIIRLSADLVNVEVRLREAERALGTVNQAIGSSREQLAKTASDLAATETEMERVTETALEMLGLQTRITAWIAKAGAAETLHREKTFRCQ